MHPEQDAKTFVHVTHADAGFEKRSELRFGNSDAVVFNLNMKTRSLEPGTKANCPAIELAGQPVPDGVFDDRLQNHAGNEAIESAGPDLFLKTQFVTEAHHFDGEIVIDKRNFFAEG